MFHLTLILVCSLLIPRTTSTSTSEATSVELNESQLESYFRQCDLNSDSYLDQEELPRWVGLMVEAHVQENVPAARAEFGRVDVNRDKVVTWEEYRITMAHHLHGEQPAFTEREQRHKFRTADENGDGVLNIIEYVALRNPMTTGYVLKRVAQELLEDFDTDKDRRVSLDEFVHHDASRAGDAEDSEIDQLRRAEFTAVMDTNRDKFLDVLEFRAYLDPRGRNFLTNEARLMMHEADKDQDFRLSMGEVKGKYLHFQRHKENQVIKAIHDEF